MIYVNKFIEYWTILLLSVTVIVATPAQTTNLEEKGRLTDPAKFRSKGKDLEYLFPFTGIFFICNLPTFFINKVYIEQKIQFIHEYGFFPHIRQQSALMSFHP